MPRVVALVFPVLLAACAAAPRPESRPESQRCGAASGRVEYLLREGLDSYLDGMRRYASARDPSSRRRPPRSASRRVRTRG